MHCVVFCDKKFVDFFFDLPGHHTEAWVELYICYRTLERKLLAREKLFNVNPSFVQQSALPDVLL